MKTRAGFFMHASAVFGHVLGFCFISGHCARGEKAGRDNPISDFPGNPNFCTYQRCLDPPGCKASRSGVSRVVGGFMDWSVMLGTLSYDFYSLSYSVLRGLQQWS